VPPTLGIPADPALARARSHAVAKHPHLYRRQAVYWFRRRPPQALANFFSNREIRLSLRTHFRPEAATRAARLRVVTDLAFRDLERAVTNGLTLPDQTFDQLVNRLVQDELDRCERERELAGPRTEADIQQAVLDHQRQRARLQQALRTNNYAGLERELSRAVAAVQDCASEDDLRALQRRATRGLLSATQINERREQGIYEFETSDVQSVAVVNGPNLSLGRTAPSEMHAEPMCEEPSFVPGPSAPGDTSKLEIDARNVVCLKRNQGARSSTDAAQGVDRRRVSAPIGVPST
jgi:hypothetical protein